MEANLYIAIINQLEDQNARNRLELITAEERRLFTKRMEGYSLDNGQLRHHGLLIPITSEIEPVIADLHVPDGSQSHHRKVQPIVTALVKKGYTMPRLWGGGLERLVNK